MEEFAPAPGLLLFGDIVAVLALWVPLLIIAVLVVREQMKRAMTYLERQQAKETADANTPAPGTEASQDGKS